jgi:prophage antirepressor-like protein
MTYTLEFNDIRVGAAWIDGDLWLPMKDVAQLVGLKNPRQMMQGLGESACEQKIMGKNAKGMNVPIIHIPSHNVMALINKSKAVNKEDLGTWLENAVAAARKRAGVQIVADSSGDGPDASKIAAPKTIKKSRPKAYAIKAEDYAQLAGKSLSTIYSWARESKLPKAHFLKKVGVGMDKYYLVTERDIAYETIAMHLENKCDEFGIVSEVKVEVIGKIDS